MFFNIVKDLFKSFEFICRNVNIPLGFKAEGIFVLGGLRKKYLARCQFSYHLYTVQQKVFFNIVKDLFKSFEFL